MTVLKYGGIFVLGGLCMFFIGIPLIALIYYLRNGSPIG